MNEVIFFIQISLVAGSCLLAFKLNREALFVLISLQAVLANFLVLKQVQLFGLQVTASDAFAIGSILSLNLLQEKFGREDSKRATWICLGSLFFVALSTQIHLFYVPSQSDTTQLHYEQILSHAPRLFWASVTSFFLVQQFDLRFYGFLKKKRSDWHFGLRSTISLLVSQALDTFLFSILGLWGLVESLPQVFLFSYLIKILIIFAIWVFAR